MDYQYDVFISYSRKDTEIADKICEAFNNVGITYFIDRQGIGGGMEFPAVLARAIRESKVFLFLASKNSYESKFTQSEIVYAFNKKQKQDIIPYIIDGSTLPDELEFTFSAINWRQMDRHPIETVLVNDVLSKVGKQRQNSEEDGLPVDSEDDGNKDDGSSTAIGLVNKYISGFNFTGKHLAWIALAYSVILFLVMLLLTKNYLDAHRSTIENVVMISIIAFILFSVIGIIRPASVALNNRTDVLKYYISSVFISFMALACLVGHDSKAGNDSQSAILDTQQTDTVYMLKDQEKVSDSLK